MGLFSLNLGSYSQINKYDFKCGFLVIGISMPRAHYCSTLSSVSSAWGNKIKDNYTNSWGLTGFENESYPDSWANCWEDHLIIAPKGKFVFYLNYHSIVCKTQLEAIHKFLLDSNFNVSIVNDKKSNTATLEYEAKMPGDAFCIEKYSGDRGGIFEVVNFNDKNKFNATFSINNSLENQTKDKKLDNNVDEKSDVTTENDCNVKTPKNNSFSFFRRMKSIIYKKYDYEFSDLKQI